MWKPKEKTVVDGTVRDRLARLVQGHDIWPGAPVRKSPATTVTMPRLAETPTLPIFAVAPDYVAATAPVLADAAITDVAGDVSLLGPHFAPNEAQLRGSGPKAIMSVSSRPEGSGASEVATFSAKADVRPPRTGESGLGLGTIDATAEHLPDPEAEQATVLRPQLSGVFASAARWGVRKPHVYAMLAVLGVGLLLGVWLLLKAKPLELNPPTITPSVVVTPTATPSPSTPPHTVVVHVLGAVLKPGLVTLNADARVADAVAAAGGLSAEADPSELNLASAVVDGSQIVIGTRGQPRGEVRGSGAGSSNAGGPQVPGGVPENVTQKVNLNTATLAQLDSLPGVGPVTAQKILDHRTKRGKFSRVEELQEVEGIGPKSFQRLVAYVTV